MKDWVYGGNHRIKGSQKNYYFYLESVAPPLQEDRAKIQDADLRTLHRLMMYDGIAFQQLKKYFSSELINRVPAFTSTLAMYDKMCDCTHYPWYINILVHSYMYIHTYAHTYICSYIHMHIHTYAHTYIYSYIHVPMHTYTQGCKNASIICPH